MSLRDSMKKMTENSQKFMDVPECTCASCGHTVTRAALNLVWYYDDPGAKHIAGGLLKPLGDGSRVIVQFPICEVCAPPCKKCHLPVKTRAVQKTRKRISNQLGREVSGFPGCRHTHLPGFGLFSNLFGGQNRRLRKEEGNRVKARTVRQRSAQEQPDLSVITNTIENLIQEDRDTLAKGKIPERRLIPHHAIKRDIVLQALQIDHQNKISKGLNGKKEDQQKEFERIRRMDQHQLDELIERMRREREDLSEIEDYVRSKNSLYRIVDRIFENAADSNPSRDKSRAAAPRFEIDMEEPNQGFVELWNAAGRHLQSQTHDAPISWLKAGLEPPFLEHLSFRLGNQLFYVRVVDAEGDVQSPGNPEGVKSIARGCNGHACLIPMIFKDGQWEPQKPGWGLVDASSGAKVDPYSLVTKEKIEMTDWELHDFAVQTVRDHIKDKLGFQIMSSQGNPDVNPSIWFVGENGPEWVVVRAVRYPTRDAPLPRNIQTIANGCSKIGRSGHFASVAICSSEQAFENAVNSAVEPLWRGHGMYVSFQGMKPVDPSGPVPL